MLENLVKDTLKQVPALVVLAFIVTQFLSFLGDVGDKVECFHKDAMLVIKENTVIQGKVLVVLEHIENETKHYSE